MNYSIVIQGLVKISTRMDGYQGSIQVGSSFSGFDSVRSPYTVVTKDQKYGGVAPVTMLALLSRDALRNESSQGIPAALQRFEWRDWNMYKDVDLGTSWRVRLAQHKLNKKWYALKVIHKKALDIDPRAHANMQRLSQARELMELCTSPYLVQLHGCGFGKRHLFMAVDFMYGGNFKVLMDSRKPLPEPHAMFYVGCLVLALEHLRERSIVHRSVRPENILIDESGSIKLSINTTIE